MQYGAELFPYKRISKDNKEESKKVEGVPSIAKLVIYFMSALLVSRNILINSMAPFGLAFLIAIVSQKNNRYSLVAGIGAILGYVSLYNNLNGAYMYVIAVGFVVVTSFITSKVSKVIEFSIMFASIFFTFLVFRTFGLNEPSTIALLTSFFETVCIAPIYYILTLSIVCFKEYKTRHLFTNEEIVSMAVAISLIVAGTWGATIYDISLRNILAMILILFVSYVKGGPVGAASGVALGIIVGISTNNMGAYVSVYGLTGLVAGMFKETGKWVTGIGFLISFFIAKVYSSMSVDFKVIEAVTSTVVFFIIPGKFYRNMTLELDWEKKKERMESSEVEKIKDIFVQRLNNFSNVLFNMSTIVNSLVDNEKLEMKNKSTALVENLADRVCSDCDMRGICWRREYYNTFSAFEELIQDFQENKSVIPEELQRKCIKRTALRKNTEEISNTFIINEMWKTRLNEGRGIVAKQISNMAETVEEIVEEFNQDIRINSEMEINVRRFLDREEIKYNNIFCYNDKNDRIIIKMGLGACGGGQMCVKEVLPMISKVTGKCMSIADEGCNLDEARENCVVTFEEMPKFHIASYAAAQCKDGEKCNGDSYSYEKLRDGTYMTIISDGMGSGPQAGRESVAAVELIQKFTESGFSKLTAINAVNSVMTLKFSEEEKFSTVDLCTVDLYTGNTEFMKVGSVSSFIKRGEDVEVIRSSTLPIGVLDKADVETTERKVSNGDVIIMVSDGILDYDTDNVGRVEWLEKYIGSFKSGEPRDMAQKILERAKELSGSKVRDDMTVVVSKIYSLY